MHMRKSLLTLALLSVISAPALAAPQQSDHDRIARLEAQVLALQAELQAMRSATPTPVAAVERVPASTDEIDALAADAADLTPAAPTTDAMGVAASIAGGSGGGNSSANAFNPALSVVLNGSYARHSLDSE